MNKQRVAEIAREVAMVHIAGHWAGPVAGRHFIVGPVYKASGKLQGYCARFVRQVHECALGLEAFEWPYRAANARQMESNLKRAGFQVEKPEAGDIVCFNKDGAPYGHIGIWLGGGKIAENTSSGSRGNPREPGTKITTLNTSLRKRISGYYAPLPGPEKPTTTVKLIEFGKGEIVGTVEMVVGGNHIADQGKLYILNCDGQP